MRSTRAKGGDVDHKVSPLTPVPTLPPTPGPSSCFAPRQVILINWVVVSGLGATIFMDEGRLYAVDGASLKMGAANSIRL